MNLSTTKNLVEDEYLVTPPLTVEEAGAYKVTLDFAVGYNGGEKLELVLGKGKTAEELNIPVQTITSFESLRSKYEIYVQIPEGGKYYLGLHACSENVAYYGCSYTLYGLNGKKPLSFPNKSPTLQPFHSPT